MQLVFSFIAEDIHRSDNPIAENSKRRDFVEQLLLKVEMQRMIKYLPQCKTFTSM